MKEFNPSKGFVSRVMKDVHAYEKKKETDLPLSLKIISYKPIRYAMSAFGILLGIINLIRMYFTVFAPVVCR